MMLRNRPVLVLVVAIAFATPWTADTSGDVEPTALGQGSVLWIEGTSTVHDFKCETEKVELVLTLAGDAVRPSSATDLMRLIRASSVSQVEVRVPVASLRSEKTALDRNLRKAMRADEHPDVRFKLGAYEVGTPAGDDTLTIRSKGSLTIAGRERPIDLETDVWREGTGVRLAGSERIAMSDYGIKPPTMMLGTLRVGDVVTVRYRLLLVPRNDGSSPK
jgi:hypothetical protein